MTSVRDHASHLVGLPREVAGLAHVLQGLLIHEHIAGAYGVTLSDERRSTVHIRPVERILEQVLATDARPVTTARPADRRIAGNCRHFTVFMVALLRSQGVPARARCGFGSYLVTDRFEDHWVCEYWRPEEARWSLVDAQIDEVQRAMFRPGFDLLDVPRDRFVVAGDAWLRCRAGEADPATYGLSSIDQAGLWWVAGNLLRLPSTTWRCCRGTSGAQCRDPPSRLTTTCAASSTTSRGSRRLPTRGSTSCTSSAGATTGCACRPSSLTPC